MKKSIFASLCLFACLMFVVGIFISGCGQVAPVSHPTPSPSVTPTSTATASATSTATSTATATATGSISPTPTPSDLYVVSQSPALGATNVSKSGTASITFSSTIDAAVISETEAINGFWNYVTMESDHAAGTPTSESTISFSWSADGKTITLSGNRSWTGASTEAKLVHLTAMANKIKDINGMYLAGGTDLWKYSLAPLPALTILSMHPTFNATGVASNEYISLTFSNTIDASSFGSNWSTMEAGVHDAGDPIGAVDTFESGNTVLRIDVSSWEGSTPWSGSMEVSVISNANGLRDIDGVPLASETRLWRFTLAELPHYTISGEVKFHNSDGGAVTGGATVEVPAWGRFVAADPSTGIYAIKVTAESFSDVTFIVSKEGYAPTVEVFSISGDTTHHFSINPKEWDVLNFGGAKILEIISGESYASGTVEVAGLMLAQQGDGAGLLRADASAPTTWTDASIGLPSGEAVVEWFDMGTGESGLAGIIAVDAQGWVFNLTSETTGWGALDMGGGR